ncbi:MAG: dTDP-glucose 4,6-dehydratase [Anaerolineaceae bacterium]|nr:dTDP-glucose 4,6-dehydratase [Anaerolineaceae bacterium]
MNQNMLITGGAGFIGSNFIRYIQEQAPEVNIVNLDLLTYAGSQENLRDLPHPEKHILVEADVSDQPLIEGLLHEHNIDTIVHFAAESHVDRSLKGPGAFVQTNIVGTFSLLEAARKVWLQEKRLGKDQLRFHHISTDEVYGSLDPGDPAFEETTPYAPTSPYAASKASSDHLVRAYAHSFGLPITISNCSNNYGPYQFPEKLIPLMILNALTGKPLPIYGDGMQIRDWLYVEDHCAAIYAILNNGKIGESYNIGGGNQPPNIEIVTTICEILDVEDALTQFRPHSQLIEYVTDRPGHDRRYAMNIDKINRDLGWAPSVNLKEGLEKTVRWYLDHIDWLNAIIKEKSYQNWVDINYQGRGTS